MCSYVDNYFYGWNAKFKKGVVDKLKERLEVGSEESRKFQMYRSGNMEIKQEKDRVDEPKTVFKG